MRFKIFFSLLIFLTVCIVSINPASAGTYYATHDAPGGGDGSWGSPWTIVEGFAQAVAGDTVKVQGGTYTNVHPVVVNSGSSGNRIVFETEGGVVALDGVDHLGYGIEMSSNSYITINGFTIFDYDIGMYGNNVNHNIYMNNEIYSNAQQGIQFMMGDYNNFEYNKIYSNGYEGILTYAFEHSTLSNNDVDDTSGGYYDYTFLYGSIGDLTVTDLVKQSDYFYCDKHILFQNTIDYDITMSGEVVMQDNPLAEGGIEIGPGEFVSEFVNITVISGKIGQIDVTSLIPDRDYQLQHVGGGIIEEQTSNGAGAATFTTDLDVPGGYNIIFFVPIFNSTWDTTKTSTGSSSNTQIRLPLESDGYYDFTVYWDDGTDDTLEPWGATSITHTYASPGVYNISIHGTITGFRFNNGGDKLKIIDVSRWGGLNVGNNGGYFHGCGNLNFSTTEPLDLTGTTNLNYMFSMYTPYEPPAPTVFNANISSWDVSGVTSMSDMFRNAVVFNQNISNWNVSNVGNMNNMFRYARAFNQNINNWDVSSVISMDHMFCEAVAFNQPIGSWDVSSVINMDHMFSHASSFNQPIASWDVSSVTTMTFMFVSSAFNQPIASWDVSSVTNMIGLFESSSFNQPIGSWDVSSVTDMWRMFSHDSLSTANYNDLLIGWASLPSLQTGVRFNSDTYYTCTAGDARNDILIGTYGWIIIDGGITGNVSSVTSSLMTEHQINPTELTTNISAPYFNWTYSDADNDPQYSWQIQVGTTSGASDMWDSGQLLGTDTSDIYAGSTLSTGITYYLRVRTSDSCQNSSWATGTFDIAATPTPVNIANTTGFDWINWTFEKGTGIVETDSFNTSVNGANWINGSSDLYRNATSLSLHVPHIIDIYAWNDTYGLSSVLTDTMMIPNNVPILTNVLATYGLYENYTLNIDANYTDLDGDIITFFDNSSDWNIDSSTGVVSWITDHSDIGIHNWRITINDDYGGTDYIDFTVTVHEASEDMIITSTDPSATFDLELDDSQLLTITLDRNATLIWYIDGEESRTDYNSTSSSYYFTSSTTGIFNITVVCNASVPVFTQLNYSWFITVTSTSELPVTHAPIPYRDTETPYEEYPDEEYPDEVTPEKEGILDNVNGVVIALAIVFFILLFLAIIRSGNGYEFSPRFRPPNR